MVAGRFDNGRRGFDRSWALPCRRPVHERPVGGFWTICGRCL